MNVTKDGIKDRQLHIEDYLQMVSAEQKEYAEVSAHQRIAENNDIITDFQTDRLMEKILSNDNLNQAYKKVKSNKGAGGVDGMSVDELLSFLHFFCFCRISYSHLHNAQICVLCVSVPCLVHSALCY